MEMTEKLRKFVKVHADDDLPELLLHASRYQVDMRVAVIQIRARRQILEKLPAWYSDDRLFFPSTLATEQCSSEITALYKQRLVNDDDWVCDLTGGLGVDSCSFAQKVQRVTYVDRDDACCDAAKINLRLLGVDNIHVIHGDAVEMIANGDSRIVGADVFYIDPSRRGAGDKRLFAINSCEPDLMKIIALLPKPYRMIIKLSPMLDVVQAISQIPHAREVHVVSIKNECKELVFVTSPLIAGSTAACLSEASREQLLNTDHAFYCVNYTSDGTEQSFRFRLQDERAAVVHLAKQAGRYLYEPNASILKAGAYKAVALQFDMEKLHVSSHLYTSDRLIKAFPGRIFEISAIIPFCSHIYKTLKAIIPKANIAVRNFPLSVDELRKRTHIAEGGDVYLFATTLSDNQKALLKCSRL